MIRMGWLMPELLQPVEGSLSIPFIDICLFGVQNHLTIKASRRHPSAGEYLPPPVGGGVGEAGLGGFWVWRPASVHWRVTGGDVTVTSFVHSWMVFAAGGSRYTCLHHEVGCLRHGAGKRDPRYIEELACREPLRWCCDRRPGWKGGKSRHGRGGWHQRLRLAAKLRAGRVLT